MFVLTLSTSISSPMMNAPIAKSRCLFGPLLQILQAADMLAVINTCGTVPRPVMARSRACGFGGQAVPRRNRSQDP